MNAFYAEAGGTSRTVLRTIGASPKSDAEESLAVAVQVIRRTSLRVVVGVSAPGFAAMRNLARRTMDSGAAGVMIAPPPSLRTDEQITSYFRQAIEAIGEDIPWVLRDYPLTLNVVMTPSVIC